MDEVACITVCQGEPRCSLLGDDAIAAQKAGCPWCERIYLDEFGGQTVVAPSADIRGKS